MDAARGGGGLDIGAGESRDDRVERVEFRFCQHLVGVLVGQRDRVGGGRIGEGRRVGVTGGDEFDVRQPA